MRLKSAAYVHYTRNTALSPYRINAIFNRTKSRRSATNTNCIDTNTFQDYLNTLSIMEKFSRKQYYTNVLRLAFPVILSQAGQIFVQLADNAMVGRLGAVPLAGVSFANSVFFMLFVLGMGMTMGLTPLVGEMYSISNHRKTAAYLQNSILFYGCIGIVIFLLAMAVKPFMHSMGQTPEVVEQAIPYFNYVALSVIPFMIFAAFKQFLEGVGNTKVAMAIIITSNIINIICNWLFIYGNLGCPKMGAAGAGLGTLISRIMTPILIITYFYKRDSFARYFAFFSRDKFSFATIKSLIRVGSPISLQMFMEGGGFALIGIMMGWLGTNEMAGNQVATVISNFAFMIIIGIGSAVTICVSHAYGRRDWMEIRRYTGTAYRLGLMWNAITAITFISLRRYIPMIFTSDPAVIDMAAHFLVFVAIFQISDGLQANSVAVLRGIQDVKSIMVISFISYILISLPTGYMLAFHTPIRESGLWIGVIIGLAVAAVLYYLRIRKQTVRHLRADTDITETALR